MIHTRVFGSALFVPMATCVAGFLAGLLLSGPTPTSVWRDRRVGWDRDASTAATLDVRKVARLLEDWLFSKEDPSSGQKSPFVKSELVLYAEDNVPPFVIEFRDRSSLDEICAGLYDALRPVFPGEVGYGTSNRGELRFELLDGTSLVFWFNDVGFSTRPDVVEEPSIFYSRELSNTLYHAVLSQGDKLKRYRVIFESQLEYWGGDERSRGQSSLRNYLPGHINGSSCI